MFASPALLNRVGAYGKARGVRLPTLKRVVSAGAPVSPANIEQFSAMLSEEAQVHTPYGATEAVPIISIGSREILSQTRPLSEKGYGMCVGRPMGNASVALIRISDDPIPRWHADLQVPDGEIGEIAVQGATGDPGLLRRRPGRCPGQNSGRRILLAPHGRPGLAGQKKDGSGSAVGRVTGWSLKPALFSPSPARPSSTNHPAVFRSALVGVGPAENQTPVICIELSAGDKTPRAQIRDELLSMARTNVLTQTIDTIVFHRGFPVDIRHNSKIFREQLAVWAARKLGGR